MDVEEQHAVDGPRQLKKLEKKRREICRLQEQTLAGRALSAAEQSKVGSLASVELQIGLLATLQPPQQQQTPLAAANSASGSLLTSGAALSAAPTLPAAAVVAAHVSSSQSALAELMPPPTR
eukprot:3723177-Prymnesium_polylepis.1